MTIPSPLFSFIVLVHNMPREAPRTLFTLSTAYQIASDQIPYEVIVIENGSTEPLDEASVTSFGPQFRYIYYDTNSVSPVHAMHEAAIQSRGTYIVIMNDGARMLSPGILAYMNRAVNAFNDPVIAAPGYHLGPTTQNISMATGYNQETEDRLLDTVPWKNDGYRLFDIAALAGSSAQGWFIPLAESNCVTLSRRAYDEIGGVCREFQTPGGGFIALDFFKNAWEHAGSAPVMLLGEGTFHQFHGGTTTNTLLEEQQKRIKAMSDEYIKIRGKPFEPPTRPPHYMGHLPKPSARFAAFSAQQFLNANPAFVVPGMETCVSVPSPAPVQPPTLLQRIRTRLSP